jgi:hypothetical protein
MTTYQKFPEHSLASVSELLLLAEEKKKPLKIKGFCILAEKGIRTAIGYEPQVKFPPIYPRGPEP